MVPKVDESSKEEPEYIIERIVSKKILPNRKVKYEVKWKGYDENENTYEPLENFNRYPGDVIDLWEGTTHKNYQVERILASKVEQNGEKLYLVKWLGWGMNYATWEKTTDFVDPQIPLKFRDQCLIEQILGKEIDENGITKYLCKWRDVEDIPDNHSWHTREDINHFGLVDEFEKLQSNMQNKKHAKTFENSISKRKSCKRTKKPNQEFKMSFSNSAVGNGGKAKLARPNENPEGFCVEKILDRKLNSKRKPIYLCKWLGYDTQLKNMTWETRENIRNDGLVDSFEKMWTRKEENPKLTKVTKSKSVYFKRSKRQSALTTTITKVKSAKTTDVRHSNKNNFQSSKSKSTTVVIPNSFLTPPNSSDEDSEVEANTKTIKSQLYVMFDSDQTSLKAKDVANQKFKVTKKKMGFRCYHLYKFSRQF